MKIEETLITVKNKLIERISLIDNSKKLKVEIAKTSDYNNININGTLFIIYRGDSFGDNKINSGQVFNLNRKIVITILGVLTKVVATNITWYIDFIIESLTGIKTNEGFGDKHITPVSAERLDEDEFNNSCFGITFNIPTTYNFNDGVTNEDN